MATDLRRYKISITPSMEIDLGMVKKEWYCQETQNDMFRDLIIRGLASLESETKESGDSSNQLS